MKQSYLSSFKPLANLCLSGMALAVLSACGGGSSGSAPVPVIAETGTCLDGKVNNTVGVEDPFYVNSWHLKNTGANQAVSAFENYGVAGIDANVENVQQAGKGCTGNGVTIAIVDSGMEIGHEDLKQNVLRDKSFNFFDHGSDPSPDLKQSTLDHGTGVAGIAAARGWNGMGSRGIAPFASLVAYPINRRDKPYADPSTTFQNISYLAFGDAAEADPNEKVTAAFGERANAIDIFNYSAGRDYAAPRQIVDGFDPLLELVAKYGTKNLRGRLGAIYFQAAGNEFETMETGNLPDDTVIYVDCAATLKMDASKLGGELSNLAGMSCGNSNQDPDAKPYFYQVAAIHNTGKAASYSSAGAANWITGFGGEYGTTQAAIISTDNSGCNSGTNNTSNQQEWLSKWGNKISKMIADLLGATGSKDLNCNYTGTMQGTSAAAPSVAGVAALMLEANPKLTWQDVGYILAKTARRVDDGIASGKDAVTFKPTGATVPWNIEESWIKNAAGFNFQNRYGFGLADASAAVKLAANYTAPAGRRVEPRVAIGAKSTSSVPPSSPNIGLNSSTVQFADQAAITGALRLDLKITNRTGVDINPGLLQFEILNTVTGTKSIVLPAFSSWYVGGKKFPIAGAKGPGQLTLRFQTNAFYGEAVKGLYKISVIDFSGSSGAADKTLDFESTLTSYSL